MSHLGRLVAEAAATLMRTRLRTVLMVLLISMSTVIFLVVSSFARASSESLSEAVDNDLGATGTYRLILPRGLGMTSAELTAAMRQAMTPWNLVRLAVADVVASMPAECPPFAVMGAPVLVVQRDENNRPVQLPFGTGLPAGTQLCLDGLQVPSAALYLPTPAERRVWGESTVFLAPEYEREVMLAAREPGHMEYLVVTGRAEDEQTRLKEAATDALRQRASLQSVSLGEIVTIARVDSSPSLRAATSAITGVYLGIGWGVLLLGALGILVAQLIVIRDRSWYFGLARAVGATPADVAILVIMEVGLVVIAGLGVALAVAAVVEPLVDTISREVLHVPLHLLDVGVVPQVVVATLGVMVVGAAYPSFRAARLDPLDVLERR